MVPSKARTHVGRGHPKRKGKLINNGVAASCAGAEIDESTLCIHFQKFLFCARAETRVAQISFFPFLVSGEKYYGNLINTERIELTAFAIRAYGKFLSDFFYYVSAFTRFVHSQGDSKQPLGNENQDRFLTANYNRYKR